MSDPHSVLIDSCAMARLSIYIEFCDSLKKGYGTPLSELFSCLPSPLMRECMEAGVIKDGYECYRYLYDLKQQGDLIVYFSKFAKTELFDIFLDISFDEMLASHGIPFRLRRKKPLRWQIKFDFNKKVVARYDKIEKCLDDIGVSLTCPECDPRSSHRLTCEIGDVLLSHIFLDSFDSYFYSLGLFFMVDDIFTYDNEFKAILTDFSIRPEWRTHRETLEKEIIAIDSDYQSLCMVERVDGTGFDIDLAKFKLPQMLPS